MKKFLSLNIRTYIPVLFICLFFILSFASSLRESLTFDEIVYLQEGRNAVAAQTFDIDPYNPPLAQEIAVYPYILSNEFYKGDAFLLKNPLWGRLFILFVSSGLFILVYLFVLKCFGQKEAFFALFLLSLEPNLLAHSHYVTLDAVLTLFIFLAFVQLLTVLGNPSKKNIILLCIAVGLGMATKLSFIPYFFVSTCIILGIKYKGKLFSLFRKNLKGIVLGSILTLFIIWATYLFNWHVVVKQREDNSRVSVKIMHYAKQYNLAFLASTIDFLETQPVPLGDYLATVKNSVLRSLHTQQCFFLGNMYPSCRWYFMPVNFLLKTPIPLLIFFAVSLFIFAKQKKRNEVGIFLFIFGGVIFLSSMIFPLNPLARYILPFYPFFIVFASLSITFWLKTNFRQIIFFLLLLWLALGTFHAFPHFISYANELTFGQKYYLLTDSNIDWGQSLPDVSQFVKSHKDNTILFSYFGRDNGDLYGLQSNKLYGSYKLPEICEFHLIGHNAKKIITLISISNWTACGYNTYPTYAKEKIKGIVGDSIFIF